MTDLGKYLYCIIPCSEERAFDDVVSLGGVGSPVHTLPHDGLAAVVSDSPLAKYESTRTNMLAHQRVLERVMREFPLLPVRFGTVAAEPNAAEAVQKLLRVRQGEFHQLLSEVMGKVELGLKALWRDEKAVFDAIAAENLEIRRLRNALAGRPPQATHFDRIRLGEMVQEALHRKRAVQAARLLASLRHIPHRIVENPLLLDRMVVNAAFLVEEVRQQEFDQAVERLDAELADRLLLRYVGPVPPYNFVNIVVNWEEM